MFLITVGQIEGPCLSAHGPGRGWLQSGGLWPDWTLGPGHRAHQLLMSQEEMTTWAATGGRVGGGVQWAPQTLLQCALDTEDLVSQGLQGAGQVDGETA